MFVLDSGHQRGEAGGRLGIYKRGGPPYSTRSRARSDHPGESYSSPHGRIPRPCPGKEEQMCLRRARWTRTGPRPGVPVNPWGLCVERSVVGRSETPTNPTRRGCGVGGGANHAPPPRSAGRGRETPYSTERESRGGIGCTAGGHPQRAHPQTNLSHFDFSVGDTRVGICSYLPYNSKQMALRSTSSPSSRPAPMIGITTSSR